MNNRKEYKDVFHKRLNAIKSIYDMTACDMARKCDIPCVTMTTYVRNTRTPRSDFAVMIADGFGVSVGWLIGKEPSTERERQIEEYMQLKEKLDEMAEEIKI